MEIYINFLFLTLCLQFQCVAIEQSPKPLLPFVVDGICTMCIVSISAFVAFKYYVRDTNKRSPYPSSFSGILFVAIRYIHIFNGMLEREFFPLDSLQLRLASHFSYLLSYKMNTKKEQFSKRITINQCHDERKLIFFSLPFTFMSHSVYLRCFAAFWALTCYLLII